MPSYRKSEAQALLDKLVEIARLVELYAATLWQLRYEQLRLRAELDATGHRPGEPELQELLL
jgi:hypothetical protein